MSGRVVIFIQDDIGGLFKTKTMIGIKGDLISAKALRPFGNNAVRPIDDKTFGFIRTRARPRPDVELLQDCRIGDLDWSGEIASFDGDLKRRPLRRQTRRKKQYDCKCSCKRNLTVFCAESD